VRAAESLEGGLNRNSSPQAIAATREIYDRFLAKFPLFFGYWKKYADLEFSIAGTEAAEMVRLALPEFNECSLMAYLGV
jgi:pre-mRNA-processing factor 39